MSLKVQQLNSSLIQMFSVFINIIWKQIPNLKVEAALIEFEKCG